MANKTQPTTASVAEFLDGVADERRRADAREVCELLEEVTGQPPVMWGTAIVGFGLHRYTFESGRSGNWFLAGFSPRKAQLVLYLTGGFATRRSLLDRLGKHTSGVGCVNVKRLADVDRDVLRELVQASVDDVLGRPG